MKNRVEKRTNHITRIPEGFCCARFQCSDCVFFDRSDYDKYGDCYCKIVGKYVPADDYTCRDFEWRK